MSTSTDRRLALSALSNWLAFAATLAVAFFLMPHLLRTLGDEAYGTWAFVESLLAYFTLFDLGIAAAVVRFVARHHAAGDQPRLDRLASTCLGLFGVLGLAAFALGAVVLPPLVSSMGGDLVPFALLMLGNLAATLPLSLFPAILDGRGHFGRKSAVRIAALAVRTVGTLLILDRAPTLWNLGLLFTACNLAEHAALAVLAHRSLPGLRLTWRSLDRPTLREVAGYGGNAFLAMVAGRISAQAGMIIVGTMLGAAPVVVLAVAMRLVEFSKALLRQATIALTPAVSALDAAGDAEALRSMFLRATQVALYLILPIQVGLIAFGRPFLAIWLGDAGYADAAFPALVVLASTLSLAVAQSVAARFLYGMSRLRVFAGIAMLEAGANVGLSLVLCTWFGVEGVAVGIAVPNLAMSLWTIAHTSRLIGVPLSDYVRSGWTRPMLAVIVAAVVWSLIPTPTGWLSLAGGVAAGWVAYVIAVAGLERAAIGLRSRRVRPLLNRCAAGRP